MTAELTGDTVTENTVTMTQSQEGWQDTSITEIGGVNINDIPSQGTVVVGYDSTEKTATFTSKQ